MSLQRVATSLLAVGFSSSASATRRATCGRGKVVNSADLGGAFKKKHVGKAQHIKGTRYDGSDWRVAVVWYECAGDDNERFTFRELPSGAGFDF